MNLHSASTDIPTQAAPVRGLSEREVLARRAQGLGNTAAPPATRSYWRIFSENVFTFINISLFSIGLALAVLGRPADALVSTGVISLNILVSLVQEIRAKRVLDRVALLTRPTATVIRDGQQRAVPPSELVVGDVLKVEPGDQFVVDGRVIVDGHLAVDESLLTGESAPVPKQAGDAVYSGSFCLSGSGLYEAERVGAASLSSQITASAQAFRRILTPLQQEIHLVIRIMLLIVVYLECLSALVSLLNRASLADSVANSALLAGLVPNGLLLSIAVAYALGAVRLLRYGALVQQANSIESLSHVNVLCLDKTGTLTANRLQLSGVYPFGLTEAELGGVLGTVAASAASRNRTTEAIAAAWPRPSQRLATEVPFSSARKWSAVAFAGKASRRKSPLHGVYVLGAPEMLWAHLADAPDAPLADITAVMHRLTAQGLRVVLVAYTPDASALEERGDDSRLPAGLRPLGLVSFRDELRPEAREAMAAFIRAGVQPKIISGDNPETVAALARQAGMDLHGEAISGIDLERLGEAEFAEAIESGMVFGRVTPQQKERIVRVLRLRGHYVAMIGDGVNDVLSLKQAHLAIAMQSGSQAARSVADIVLMRDSFAVLVPAVEEGQRILSGMQDILKLFLARISIVGLVVLSSLAIGTFPLEVRQGSLVTLFSVGIPAVALAVWAHPKPAPQDNIVPQLIRFILPPAIVTSMLGTLLFVGTYLLELLVTPELQAGAPGGMVADALPLAQTALTLFLAACGLILVIFVEPPTSWWTGGDVLSADWRPTWLAVVLLIILAVCSLAPPLRTVFALSPLGMREYALVAVALVIWVSFLRWAWRLRLLDRLFSVES